MRILRTAIAVMLTVVEMATTTPYSASRRALVVDGRQAVSDSWGGRQRRRRLGLRERRRGGARGTAPPARLRRGRVTECARLRRLGAFGGYRRSAEARRGCRRAGAPLDRLPPARARKVDRSRAAPEASREEVPPRWRNRAADTMHPRLSSRGGSIGTQVVTSGGRCTSRFAPLAYVG